ncbi:MAG: oligosaccharide flippase family protein [Synergistaceae bacterium]|jgi:O-antigen/teichoic acid export membrane protein|nr:oligosaccharide flippase family protein [Synergistaceae bacterium]
MLIKRRFVKHLAFYTLFAFLNKGMSFLLTPLFTRYLSPEDYGIYALFLTAIMISDPFISFCVGDVIGNVYYKPSEYPIREYVSAFLFFCAGTFGLQILGLAGLILSPLGKFDVLPWLLLAPLAALSGIVTGVLYGMWQLKENPVSYGVFNFCYILTQLLLQVGATVVLRLGWRGVLAAQGLLALLTLPVALALLARNGWLGFCFNKKCLRFGLKFGLGFIPNVLAVRLNDSIGRLLISQTLNLAETGVYSVGQKLGAVMNVYNQAFFNTYRPWLLKKLAGDARRERRKIVLSVALSFASTTAFAWAGSLCVYLFSEFILGKGFERSIVFVFWSASAYALNGMYNVVSLFIYQTGKSWILSLLTVTTVGLNALGAWRFLRVFGLIGAAYAPVLAWTATLALSIAVAAKLMKRRAQDSTKR